MSARDFFGALIDRDDLPDATTNEIDEILAVLASPLMGLLCSTTDGRFRFATAPATAASALRRIAQVIEQP